jgi:hypothetical protein
MKYCGDNKCKMDKPIIDRKLGIQYESCKRCKYGTWWNIKEYNPKMSAAQRTKDFTKRLKVFREKNGQPTYD